jgi:hypothetical protein
VVTLVISVKNDVFEKEAKENILPNNTPLYYCGFVFIILISIVFCCWCWCCVGGVVVVAAAVFYTFELNRGINSKFEIF